MPGGFIYSGLSSDPMKNRKMAGTPIYSAINAHLATGGIYLIL